MLHQNLRVSRYLAERNDALVIQSDEARKQSANVDSCYEKLYRVVEESGRTVIPGETSDDQKERVKSLYVPSIYSLPLDRAKCIIQTKSGNRGTHQD
jgi:peptidyl-tRNA hydrolase ICT1